MCGIAGQISLTGKPIERLESNLEVMGKLLAHRGPDGSGSWTKPDLTVGLSHRRLAIIDLRDEAAQPMRAKSGNVITYNGETYNYPELRASLKGAWDFTTKSDTESILAAYDKFGEGCVDHLRGMFSFAIYDDKTQSLFCARDRFGIKPFYYSVNDGVLIFASEIKALLPFLPKIETSEAVLAEYLTFQYTLGEETLFKGVNQLMPGTSLRVLKGEVSVNKYWDIQYQIDYDHSERYFHERLRELLEDSVKLHARADVPIGSYVSGGMDSSLIYRLARLQQSTSPLAFHGTFLSHQGYDESRFAAAASKDAGGELLTIDITADDFSRNIEKVIYHLDQPVAGPGSFPQFMVSSLAAEHVKVVLGGQGGDEIFGGYARYLVAYFEQCIKASIDGLSGNGNYVVTLESIIPNLGVLREYKPMIKQFWREGLFQPMDERYYRLIDRSVDMGDEINWAALDTNAIFNRFAEIFNNPSNVSKDAYFDKMTHFDFKCLLPALLQVEDRMSMAHGLESRVPLLDHPLVEFAATIPADMKFKNGNMKYLLKRVFAENIPTEIINRRDKMGFPVPLKEWFSGDLNEFVLDTYSTMASRDREYINSSAVLSGLSEDTQFSRKSWGLMSLELWHQQFHDKALEWRKYSLQG